MKNFTTPFGLFGLGYLLFGTTMSVLVFFDRMWPMSIFFISMAIGILLLILNEPTKRLPKYRLWQTLVAILPVVILLVRAEVRDMGRPKVEDDVGLTQIEFLSPYQNGDIIFQTSKSNQSRAIQLATDSKYSHMGIIFENDGQFFVYEAIEPVKLTSLKDWIERGENGHYVIRRLKNADQILTNSTLAKMKQVGEQFKGKPYDIYFEWSDDKIYCSELVWKIYKQAAKVEIGQLEQLSDFDLTNEIVQTQMKERYGNTIPMNEKVISPAAMFNSDKLITIEEK